MRTWGTEQHHDLRFEKKSWTATNEFASIKQTQVYEAYLSDPKINQNLCSVPLLCHYKW